MSSDFAYWLSGRANERTDDLKVNPTICIDQCLCQACEANSFLITFNVTLHAAKPIRDSHYPIQVALIAILAQVGSFVPAEEAQVGVLDAVYTRYEILQILQMFVL